jgi:hypothetical protein
MKKILIFLLFISFGYGCVFAQKGFNIQVVLQPGASFIFGDKFSRTSTSYTSASIKKNFTFGFEGGVNGGYNFTKDFGLSLGALYSRQGQYYYDYKLIELGNSTPTTLKNKVSLSYIKIPLRLNFNGDPGKLISFTCYAGVYLEVLLTYKDTYKKTHSDSYYTQIMESDEVRIDYGNSLVNNSISYELIGKPFKSINYGVTAGAGIQTRLSEKLSLQFMLNYELGIGDIKDLTCQYSPSNDPNRSVINRNSMAGLLIGLKKTF